MTSNTEVLEALAAMEADPVHSESVAGIRDQWGQRVSAKAAGANRPSVPGSDDAVVSQRVPVRTPKAHATIWGKSVRTTLDVPRPARDVLKEIVSVPGVSQIQLQTFGKGPKNRGVAAHVRRPSEDGSIHGFIVDPQGRKGQKQSFSATVLERGSEDRVYQAIVTRLKHGNYWIPAAGD